MKKLLALLLSFCLSSVAYAGIPGAIYQPSAGTNTVGTLPINCGGTAGTTQQNALNNIAPSGATTNQAIMYNGSNWVAQNPITVANYFGTGIDGALNVTSGTTSLSVTQDAGPLIKNYSSISISSGATLTVNNRCKGLILYCTGNCTVNGSISMNGLGASAAGASSTLSQYSTSAGSGDGITSGEGPYNLSTISYVIPSAGGSGGSGGAAPSNGGTITNASGGGGGGGGDGNGGSTGGTGSAGTSYSGGSGGGGGTFSVTAGNASTNGGSGGNGANASRSGDGGGGGGAGHPGGTGGTSTSGTPGSTPTGGGGGVIILIVGGNLTIGSGGLISANGANGGAGGGAQTSGFINAGGGGGGGGGLIVIFYAGTLSNSGTIEVNGGSGGTAGTTAGGGTAHAGGNGGAGSVIGPTQVLN